MSRQKRFCLGLSQDSSGLSGHVWCRSRRCPFRHVPPSAQWCQMWTEFDEGGSDKCLISILLNKPGTLPSAYMSTLGACAGHKLMTQFASVALLPHWTSRKEYSKLHHHYSRSILLLIRKLKYSKILPVMWNISNYQSLIIQCFHSIKESACKNDDKCWTTPGSDRFYN